MYIRPKICYTSWTYYIWRILFTSQKLKITACRHLNLPRFFRKRANLNLQYNITDYNFGGWCSYFYTSLIKNYLKNKRNFPIIKMINLNIHLALKIGNKKFRSFFAFYTVFSCNLDTSAK